MTKAFLTIPAMAIILALATGCRVEEHKNGDNEDVKIATPFGGMSVKTDQSAVQDGVGLAVYPGATLLKEDNKNSGSADVNFSFGSFHLGVKAVSYQTSDSPDKVTAFYRKDMARYGAVILCRNGHAVGTPDHTQDGLTCNSDHGSKGDWDDDSKDELKAGSRQRQHIVAVEQKGGGTKIGLVSLELPSQLNDEKSQD
jgi:hypothetical protein